MSELRQNFATKEWVVIATERARRPEEMAHHRERKPVASFVASCPFLSGQREVDSAGSSARAGRHGCSVARASNTQ